LCFFSIFRYRKWNMREKEEAETDECLFQTLLQIVGKVEKTRELFIESHRKFSFSNQARKTNRNPVVLTSRFSSWKMVKWFFWKMGSHFLSIGIRVGTFDYERVCFSFFIDDVLCNGWIDWRRSWRDVRNRIGATFAAMNRPIIVLRH